jgi:hypothetical protein
VSHGQLFVLGHATAGGLFSVAESRIKKQEPVFSHIGETSTAPSFAKAVS